jgi:hypothetical protein
VYFEVWGCAPFEDLMRSEIFMAYENI